MAEKRPRGGAAGAGGDAVSSRNLRRRGAAGDPDRAGKWGRSRRAWVSVLGGLAAAVAAVGTAAAMSGHHRAAHAAATITTTTAPPAPTAVCPLLGTPAPGNSVPARPALAVKIGNLTGDRPSAGLDQADIVYEEPVEGGITRLVAVFQCRSAPLVGDLRSARQPDVGILSQLSHPLFLHAGGIAPVLSLLAEAPLTDENVLAGGASSAIVDQPGRYAPYSTFTSTAAAWALDPSDTTPPAPVFSYGTALPAGAAAGTGGSVHIPFSPSSDVTWQWSASTGTYLRSYSGAPDILIGGSQTAATNVVVMSVQTSIGSWIENEQGGREVLVAPTGSGPLVVLRGGAAVSGTWSRPSESQPATLTSGSGVPVTLAPGNTWVELVPSGVPVTTSPVATPVAAAVASAGAASSPHQPGSAPAEASSSRR